MAEIQLHYLGCKWHFIGPAGSTFAPHHPPGFVSSSHRTSLTALGIALMRTAHVRLDPRPLIDDRWGDRLVPEAVRTAYREMAMANFDAVASAQGMAPPDAVLDAYLGATMFLTREANLATFRAIARCGAPGSERVFTCLDEREFHLQSKSFRALHESMLATGEPLRSGFDPGRLGEDLREAGLELLEDLTEVQLMERLSRDGTHGLTPLGYSHIAHARITRSGLSRRREKQA